MTPEERKLWFLFLRDYPIRFYRQRVIGDYIADFYCAKAKLVIELDGAQHAEADAADDDENRRVEMEKLGYKVARRTIAKYRALLDIPKARLRREL